MVADPDFGWHYRLGEIIIKNGFPAYDPFSYTMPSYPFVDFEWGMNVLIYLSEKYLGQWASAVIWSAAAIMAFWIAVPKKNKKYWWWAMWLGLAVGVARFAVRPQVASWLLTAAAVRILYDRLLPKKWRWGFVPLMWLWANLHGSYFVGLGLWGVWWGMLMLRERKIYMEETMIGLCAGLATVINPYGIRNWQEVAGQMQLTGFYAATLEEWQPFWKKIDPGMLAMWVWLALMGWRYKSGIKPEEAAVSLAGVGMGMAGLRHGALSMIIVSPMAVKLWTESETELDKVKQYARRWKVFVSWAGGIAAITLLIECGLLLRHQVGFASRELPTAAWEYLQEKGYGQKLLVSYGWAGYVIGKNPNQKVFVDGRMPGWRWMGEVPEGESEQAFREYLNLAHQPEFTAGMILDKYDIKTVLWRKQIDLESGVTLDKWLAENGWNKKYEDNLAVIYEYE